MITIRKAQDRGAANHGWLDTKHSFSFANYYDPAHMGFGPLRVINEDRVIPGGGFPTHGHEDMEIISYVINGALEHSDSMGNGSVIRPGDIQRMTAGTGVRHSEYNGSEDTPVHFLQIWILPEKEGLNPGYEQATFGTDEKFGKLRLVASRDGREGSLILHQSVDLYASLLSAGDSLKHTLKGKTPAWIQIIKGSLSINGVLLSAGDGAGIVEEAEICIAATDDAEFLLFDFS